MNALSIEYSIYMGTLNFKKIAHFYFPTKIAE